MALFRCTDSTNEFNIDAPDWKTLSALVMRSTNDLRLTELLPGKITIFKGAKFSTNKWGMRDQHYELQKAPQTYRIAILGASIEMGVGVGDQEVFESLFEERLNNKT